MTDSSFLLAGMLKPNPESLIMIPVFSDYLRVKNTLYVAETDFRSCIISFVPVDIDKYEFSLDTSTWKNRERLTDVFEVGCISPVIVDMDDCIVAYSSLDDVNFDLSDDPSFSLYSVLKFKVQKFSEYMKLLSSIQRIPSKIWRKKQIADFQVARGHIARAQKRPTIAQNVSKAIGWRAPNRRDVVPALSDKEEIRERFVEIQQTEVSELFKDSDQENYWVESWLEIAWANVQVPTLDWEELEILVGIGLEYVSSTPSISVNYVAVYLEIISYGMLDNDDFRRALDPVWSEVRILSEQQSIISSEQSEWLIQLLDLLTTDIPDYGRVSNIYSPADGTGDTSERIELLEKYLEKSPGYVQRLYLNTDSVGEQFGELLVQILTRDFEDEIVYTELVIYTVECLLGPKQLGLSFDGRDLLLKKLYKILSEGVNTPAGREIDSVRNLIFENLEYDEF